MIKKDQGNHYQILFLDQVKPSNESALEDWNLINKVPNFPFVPGEGTSEGKYFMYTLNTCKFLEMCASHNLNLPFFLQKANGAAENVHFLTTKVY